MLEKNSHSSVDYRAEIFKIKKPQFLAENEFGGKRKWRFWR